MRLSLLICSEQHARCEAMIAALKKTTLATKLNVAHKAADAERELADDQIDLILCDIEHPESQRILNASQKCHGVPPPCIGFSASLKKVHHQRGHWISRGGADVIGIEQAELLLAMVKRESQWRRQAQSSQAIKASFADQERQVTQLVKHSHLPSCCLVDGIPSHFNPAFGQLWPDIDTHSLSHTPILDLVAKAHRAKLKALLINSSKYKRSSNLSGLALVNDTRVSVSLSPLDVGDETSTLMQLSLSQPHTQTTQQTPASAQTQAQTQAHSTPSPQPSAKPAPQSLLEDIDYHQGQSAALVYLKLKPSDPKPKLGRLVIHCLKPFLQKHDRVLAIKGRADVVLLLKRPADALSNDALLTLGNAMHQRLQQYLSKSRTPYQLGCGLADLRNYQDPAKAIINECYQAASQAILSKKPALLTDKSRHQQHQALINALQHNTLTTQLRPVANLAGDTRQRYLLQALLTDTSRPQDFELAPSDPALQQTLDQWLLSQALGLLQDAESDQIKISLFLPCSYSLLQSDSLLQQLKEQKNPLLEKHRLVLRVKAHEATKRLNETLTRCEQWRALGCEVYFDHCLSLSSELSAIKQLKPSYIMLHPSLIKHVSQASNKRIQTLSSLCPQGLIASEVNEVAQLTTVWDLGLDLIIGDIVDQNGKALTLPAMAC